MMTIGKMYLDNIYNCKCNYKKYRVPY